MAVIEGVYLGMNAVMYVEGEVFQNVKDVTLNFSRATADVTTRRNDGWRANVGTLREATASFQMIKFKGDTDAKTILDNFLSNTGRMPLPTTLNLVWFRRMGGRLLQRIPRRPALRISTRTISPAQARFSACRDPNTVN